jgi:uncharacterized protein
MTDPEQRECPPVPEPTLPPGSLPVQVGGFELLLLPERGVLVPDRRLLVVTDLHLGKGATFRSRGIALPSGDSRADLQRLTSLLVATAARRLVILGDLFHARDGRSPELHHAMLEWRKGHPGVEVLLVRGNHDLGAGDPPPELGIECRTGPVEEEGLVFRHEPAGEGEPDPRGYALAGHLHPGVRLRGEGRERMRLPCFHAAPWQAILPAFGAFTGLALVTPRPRDRIFVVGDGMVVEVPVRRRGSHSPGGLPRSL